MTRICVLIVFVLVAVLQTGANAFTLVGTVKNGTTESTDVAAKVTLINLNAGMEPVKEVTASAGRFVIEGLDANVPIYLIRIKYKGVTYSQHMHHEGGDTATAECVVYDTAPVWKAVSITIPHFLLRPVENHLQIEKIFDVTNETSPPRTIVGKRGRLLIRYPKDMIEIKALFVSILGMPIQQQPVPTDDPNVFAVDYPIKPGTTRFATSFDVPYENDAYTYVEQLDYALDAVTILTEDPAISVTSESAKLTKASSQKGLPLYKTGAIAKATEFTLNISGRGQGGGEDHSGHSHQIVISPSLAREEAIPVVVLLAVVLLGALVIAFRRPEKAASDPTLLEKHKQQLLTQVAQLDDLYKAGLISESLTPIYQSQRYVLKNKLLQVSLLLKKHSGKRRKA